MVSISNRTEKQQSLIKGIFQLYDITAIVYYFRVSRNAAHVFYEC